MVQRLLQTVAYAQVPIHHRKLQTYTWCHLQFCSQPALWEKGLSFIEQYIQTDIFELFKIVYTIVAPMTRHYCQSTRNMSGPLTQDLVRHPRLRSWPAPYRGCVSEKGPQAKIPMGYACQDKRKPRSVVYYKWIPLEFIPPNFQCAGPRRGSRENP